jgi:hypothetical protein
MNRADALPFEADERGPVKVNMSGKAAEKVSRYVYPVKNSTENGITLLIKNGYAQGVSIIPAKGKNPDAAAQYDDNDVTTMLLRGRL